MDNVGEVSTMRARYPKKWALKLNIIYIRQNWDPGSVLRTRSESRVEIVLQRQLKENLLNMGNCDIHRKNMVYENDPGCVVPNLVCISPTSPQLQFLVGCSLQRKQETPKWNGNSFPSRPGKNQYPGFGTSGKCMHGAMIFLGVRSNLGSLEIFHEDFRFASWIHGK